MRAVSLLRVLAAIFGFLASTMFALAHSLEEQAIAEYDVIADYLSIVPGPLACFSDNSFQLPSNPNPFVRVTPKLSELHKKRVCGQNDFNVDQFCTAVKESCEKSYPLAKERGCWFREPKAQVLIWLHKDHIEKVKKHARKYFDEAVKDPLILGSCCGNKIECKRFLSKVRLRVTKTKDYSFSGSTGYRYAVATDQDGKALISHQTNEVFFDENRLAYGSPETTEHILLHELGHACTVARRIGMGLLPTRFPYGKCDDESPLTLDIEPVLGKKTAACLENQSKAGIEKFSDPIFKKDKGCLNSWLHEAFATAVFSFRSNSLGHWGYGCGSPADVEHGLSRDVIQCILKRESMRSFFCAND